MHVPHLGVRKGELLVQHRFEVACPAQGGSAGALELPGQFLWEGKGSGAGVTGAMRGSSTVLPTLEPV